MQIYFDFDLTMWGLGVLVDFNYWSFNIYLGPINISIERDDG